MNQPSAPRPRRRRTTRTSVQVAERVSSALIAIGGIGTILAVTLILVFLVAVVVPLFGSSSVAAREPVSVEELGSGRPVHVAVDPYGILFASLFEDGRIEVRMLDTGSLLNELDPFAGAAPTAFSISPEGDSLALGFEDGSIVLAGFGFVATFPEAEELAGVTLPDEDAIVVHDGGILQRTPEGKVRAQRFELSLRDPLQLETPAPVDALAHLDDGDRAAFCLRTRGGRLVLAKTEERMNLLTATVEFELQENDLVYEGARSGPPDHMLLLGVGDTVLLVWNDGHVERVDARDPEEPRLAEVVDVVPDDARITALSLLIGSSTLMVGSSEGTVEAWFGTKPEDALTRDGTLFVRGHSLEVGPGAVTALSPSPRSRLLAAAFDDGSARLYHVTTAQTIAHVDAGALGDVLDVRVYPKEDGLFALSARGFGTWELDAGHPASSLSAFFAPVWYEGYAEPGHTWQSESASDDFEPKFGFAPLIYGTLKATFYSLIFGVPLALLAAIFTSEMLDRRLRVPVKSTIEMMASLPSVVLGFLAGIIIAPFAQTIIPATLAVFACLPLALLLGAYTWQLLPQQLAIRWSGWPRLVCMAVALPVGILAAVVTGPWIEQLFFAGDLVLWLDGQVGNSVGGWMLLLFPISAVLVTFLGGRFYGDWVRVRAANWSRTQCALADMVKFAGGALLTVLVALALSWGLELVGFDPRGSFVGTYEMRNALIVGFVMGFAIIPIIYTLAEDALSSVPRAPAPGLAGGRRHALADGRRGSSSRPP